MTKFIDEVIFDGSFDELDEVDNIWAIGELLKYFDLSETEF